MLAAFATTLSPDALTAIERATANGQIYLNPQGHLILRGADDPMTLAATMKILDVPRSAVEEADAAGWPGVQRLTQCFGRPILLPSGRPLSRGYDSSTGIAVWAERGFPSIPDLAPPISGFDPNGPFADDKARGAFLLATYLAAAPLTYQGTPPVIRILATDPPALALAQFIAMACTGRPAPVIEQDVSVRTATKDGAGVVIVADTCDPIRPHGKTLIIVMGDLPTVGPTIDVTVRRAWFPGRRFLDEVDAESDTLFVILLARLRDYFAAHPGAAGRDWRTMADAVEFAGLPLPKGFYASDSLYREGSPVPSNNNRDVRNV